mmetsp:Transcript_58085/g.141980  ORF Transcript_58085/g.141980 Transcript_58085/m.141980 type:complete len:123 (-) Transcript_58085:237-605(-)
MPPFLQKERRPARCWKPGFFFRSRIRVAPVGSGLDLSKKQPNLSSSKRPTTKTTQMQTNSINNKLTASLVNPDLLDTPLIYLQRLACCKDVIVNHRWWSSFFFFDDDDEDDDDDYAWSSSRF